MSDATDHEVPAVRVAVVTGAASGIGLACAQRLAADGYVVGMLGRREALLQSAAAAIGEAGGRTVVTTCDVSSSESFGAALDTVEAEVGPIDLLVNNAGVLKPATILNTPDEDWELMNGANLRGAFNGLRAASARMIASGRRGAVINVASMLGEVPVVGFGVYGATKAGIIQLTKVGALELARHGIRVNAVLPGYVATPMSDGAREDQALMDTIVQRIPARRFAEPEEVAGAVAYLASKEAVYITGTSLLIDGGYSLRP